ncbi:substrate-binding domain-containing protein [Ideonella sp. A 288]|uniref:substrate-binding domain-containing protein n=1 Tax=Ideonella sp. A 288 TaxID=1962181 RepID=UPI0018FE2C52|nr:substrate-binding domain-containing protein [Ideonella sp. A 288]
MRSSLSRRDAMFTMALALGLGGARAQGTAPAKPDAVWGSGPNAFSLATGSPGELGLLEVLATDFARTHDATVSWFKAGSGQAMRLLRERKVDMVLAHAPPAERKAVADGWATGRRLIGSNEFWILGPVDDPARLGIASDAADAFRRLQDAGAKFVSRGDNSGTHQKENEIWKAAGRTPGGAGLIVTKDFMTASMRRANDEGAYFLTDSSTFIAEQRNMPRLKRVFRGGPMLANPYHTLYLTEPTPGAATARRFGDYLASDKVQALMRDFGRDRYGEPMYNDATSTARIIGD